MQKAAQSCDPELLHGAISAACGGDPCGRAADMQSVVQLIKEHPQDLQAVGDVFSAMLQRNERFDRDRAFQEQLGRVRQAAYTALLDVFRKREADDRMKWLRFVRDLLGQSDAGASEAERTSMQFVVQASSEEADLLKAQIGLEEQAVMKRWPNGPHRFVGLPLITTLKKCIELGETGEADNLKNTMKVSDKRYWRIKVQALAECKNWMELQAMAMQRTLPAGLGYEVYVEAYLRHGEHEKALPFVQKVKSPDLQASFYSRMGMEEEAAAARARSQERAGPARLLQNMLRLS